MLKSFISSLIAISLVFVGILTSSQALAAKTASGPEISRIGTKAFEDLATCLSSYKKPVLDVFYLVDSSGSLSWTDPKYVRSDVLGSSVSELKSFANEGVTVNYAASLFSSNLTKVQGWTNLKEPDDFAAASKKLVSSIERNLGGSTDWEQGLSYANKQLASKPADHCKMLIWFTDGGINPTDDTADAIDSLARLCNAGISSNSLGDPKGPYGLLAKIRQNKISVFGVLYQNDASTLKEYKKENSDSDAKKLLDSEHSAMEFMAPLVEGTGSIQTVDPRNYFPGPGPVQCGPVDEAGFAPAGQPNGAFVRAQDPVDLAFQFLSMQAVLAGGSGKQIVDGKFNVPAGTAAFRILTTSKTWKLIGPDGSDVSLEAKDLKSNANITVSSTAGVQQIDFTVVGKKKLLGTWKFDAGKATSALYLFSGLNIELDRDQTSQIVSDRENALTGQIVRRGEFASMPIDLSVYSKAELTLSRPDSSGNLVKLDLTVELDPKSGQFKVSGLTPEANIESLDLWLSLDLGEEFNPVTANFAVDVVSKNDIASSTSNIIKLSPLEGPTGKATGVISVVGPTTQPESEFCLDDPAVRTDDTQTGTQKHPRADKFVWKFDGQETNGSPFCITVASGETKDIQVEVSNGTQANGKVVSIRTVNSKSAGAALSESLQFEFDTKEKVDEGVAFWVDVILLLLGILLPLGLLYLLNWLTTKFLPLEQTVRAEYPVQVLTGGTAKIVDKNGSPLKVEANDFKFMPDGSAARTLAIGSHGEAQAKMAVFPLLPSWFQQSANPGQRVVSLYAESGKSPSHFKDGKATEISPNHSANWFLSIPDSEFAKASGETMNGTLIVAARMANIPQYQSRVQELSVKPGLQNRIDEIRAAMTADAAKDSGKKTKTPKSPKAGKGNLGQETGSIPAVTISSVPGAPKVPGAPSAPSMPIPGAPSTGSIPGIPGAPSTGSIPGVPSANPIQPPNSIPGAPKNIPGINPPN